MTTPVQYYQPQAPVTGYGAQSYGNPAFTGDQNGYVVQQPLPGQPMPPPGYVPPNANYMPRPGAAPGVPPGLEYLTMIDQILVHQQVELLEVLTGFETQNKYEIKNSLGQRVYFAAEESDCCQRYWCGTARSFIMHIVDNMQQEVIRVRREFKCCAGCQWCACSECCALEIEIEAPVGQIVGYVRQKCSFLAPKFEICDANRQPVLRIEGPVCMCVACCEVDFKVFGIGSDEEVGKISKQWSGLAKELFTTADNFGVSFPMDLDVRIKAVLLGAVFLIDFMFFEQKKNNDNGVSGGLGLLGVVGALAS